MMKVLLIVLITLVSFFRTHGQSITQEEKGSEYVFPINPNQRNYLSGSFGEIRSSHFHTGIDIKTQGKIGIPVIAYRDGVIHRISLSPTGYGNALYMQHEDGSFSVYAHLNRFDEEIEKYTLKEQYKKEKYYINLFPKSELFPFNKGDTIAFSGNTGSSLGPHLHFEVRNKNNQPSDFLRVKPSEIIDKIPPSIEKISFSTLEKTARVNGHFGRFVFDVNDIVKGNILLSFIGKIGIEIFSYDKLDGAQNKNGISKTYLLVDGDTVFGENKSKLSFNHQRHTLNHYNYQANKYSNYRFNKLYVDKNNHHIIYTHENDGVDLSEKKVLKIICIDSYDNKTMLEILLSPTPAEEYTTQIGKIEKINQLIHIVAKHNVKLLINNQWVSLKYYFSDKDIKKYIWSLEDGIPTQYNIDSSIYLSLFIDKIPAERSKKVETKDFAIQFYQKSLFENMYLKFEKDESDKNKEYFHFWENEDPLRGSVNVTLYPKQTYDEEHSFVYSFLNNNIPSFVGGKWKNRNITFSTKTLYSYTILSDTTPPIIEPIKLTKDQLVFQVKDNLSGIRSFRLEVNEKFVLMKHDTRKNIFHAIKSDKEMSFEGDLVFNIRDNSNNIATFKRKIL